jgi:hypothetical protein
MKTVAIEDMLEIGSDTRLFYFIDHLYGLLIKDTFHNDNDERALFVLEKEFIPQQANFYAKVITYEKETVQPSVDQHDITCTLTIGNITLKMVYQGLLLLPNILSQSEHDVTVTITQNNLSDKKCILTCSAVRVGIKKFISEIYNSLESISTIDAIKFIEISNAVTGIFFSTHQIRETLRKLVHSYIIKHEYGDKLPIQLQEEILTYIIPNPYNFFTAKQRKDCLTKSENTIPAIREKSFCI